MGRRERFRGRARRGGLAHGGPAGPASSFCPDSGLGDVIFSFSGALEFSGRLV